MKELMYHSNANLTGYNDIGGKSLAYEYNLQPERQDKEEYLQQRQKLVDQKYMR